MNVKQLIRNLGKLPESETTNCCPECGGELQPTHSLEIGFCPPCRRQVRYKH